MRNKYKGICYKCGKVVEPGDGHFERHKGTWKVIHAECVFLQRIEKKQNYLEDEVVEEVKRPMIRVVNMKSYDPEPGEILIRVDRGNPILGNQFVMHDESERNEVIDQYELWIHDKIDKDDPIVMGELARIKTASLTKDIALGCWCAPKRCHGTVILKCLEASRTLQCHSKGNKKFSAMFARSSVCGVHDTIEHLYQDSKRDIHGDKPYAAKGFKPDHFIIGNTKMPLEYFSQFYTALWVKYFMANPNLLEYINLFDDFVDIFKGSSLNCQADVIKRIRFEGLKKVRMSIEPMNAYYAEHAKEVE